MDIDESRFELSKQAVKFLAKVDKNTYDNLIEAINALPSGDVKKLQNRDEFRLRKGKYRVLFEHINDKISIAHISSRGDIYKTKGLIL